MLITNIKTYKNIYYTGKCKYIVNYMVECSLTLICEGFPYRFIQLKFIIFSCWKIRRIRGLMLEIPLRDLNVVPTTTLGRPVAPAGVILLTTNVSDLRSIIFFFFVGSWGLNKHLFLTVLETGKPKICAKGEICDPSFWSAVDALWARVSLLFPGDSRKENSSEKKWFDGLITAWKSL